MKNPWNSVLQTRNILIGSIFIELILFYFYYFPESKVLLGDESRYLSTAVSIIAGADWHSDPLWPPMQSLLIAFFIKIFNQPILPLQIFQYAILVISGFIVRNIVFRETHDVRSSQLALAVMLLFPSWMAYSQYLWPEVIHVFLFVSIIWINNYKNQHLRWMLLSGFILGMAILFKSLLVLFVPFLYLAQFKSKNIKQGLLGISLSVMMAAIVISPAAIKAHHMTGGWMVSNSSMFNLWMGLQDDKRQHFSHPIGGKTLKEFDQSGDNFQQKHQQFKEKSIQKIKNDGVFKTLLFQINKQYFRLFDHQTFFSQQFTGERSENYLSKYSVSHDNWLATFVLTINNVFYFVLMVAMVFGLIVTVKKSTLSQQLALFLLYVLGLFLLLHSKPRFRIPLVPIMAMYASFLMAYIQSNNITAKVLINDKFKFLILVFTLLFISLLVFSGGVLDKYWPI